MYGIYEFIYISVYGTCNGFLCMTSMNLYIFMCICSCETRKYKQKKISGILYADGIAVGVVMTKMVSDPSYAKGLAVGVSPGYGCRDDATCHPTPRGEAVGVSPFAIGLDARRAALRQGPVRRGSLQASAQV
jgi:hypothetical protein